MKSRTVKLTKGNSVIFVTLDAVNAKGNYTEDDRETAGYAVHPGGVYSLHYHTDKAEARAEYFGRIGSLVDNGYSAEAVKIGDTEGV